VLPRISGAEIGMLVVETIAKIRRAHFVQGKPIKQICRELKLSRSEARARHRSERRAERAEGSALGRDGLRIQAHRAAAAEARAVAGGTGSAAGCERRAGQPRAGDVARGSSRWRGVPPSVRGMPRRRALGFDGEHDAVRRHAAAWTRQGSAGASAAFVPSRGTRAFGATLRAGRGLPVRLEP